MESNAQALEAVCGVEIGRMQVRAQRPGCARTAWGKSMDKQFIGIYHGWVMKTLRCALLALLVALCTTQAFAQYEYVVEISRTSGAYVKTGPAIAGITWVYMDERTYNENAGHFVFPSDQEQHRLYTIDVSDGSIVHNPLIGNVFGFQYDKGSNVIYGIEQDNVNSCKRFVSVNPVTGALTRIGNPLPYFGNYSGDWVAYDNTRHVYMIITPSPTFTPPNILISIDAMTGNVISSPYIVLAPGERMGNMTVDNSTGTLYGLVTDNTQRCYLAVINPTTGTHVKVGSGSLYGNGNGSSAVDEVNRQFIYIYSTPLAYYITTLDLATGSVLHHALIEGRVIVHNFFGLEYDHIREKLYAYHGELYPAPIVNAGPDQTIMLGYGPQSVTLSGTIEGGTAPFQFLWSDNRSGATIQVSPQVTTTYTLSVTGADNKRVSDNVTVTVADCRCGQAMDKVMVCHNGNTLCIAAEAVPAHLEHGDQLGACAAQKPIVAIQAPERAILQQNYPNPFNPVTTIPYAVTNEGRAVIRILDVYSRVIGVVEDRMLQAGTYHAVFDGTGLPAGRYVIQLECDGVRSYRHMTLIK